MVNNINEIINNKEIHTVEVLYSDSLGILRGKLVPIRNFIKNYENGFAICKASLGWDIQCELIEGTELSDFSTGCPDIFIKPLLDSFKEIHWRKGYALVLGELYEEDGTIVKLAPRQILKNIIERYKDFGYRPLVGVELEFYLLDSEKKPLYEGVQAYSRNKAIELEYVLGEIRNNLEEIGINLEATHIEYGPAQIEIIIEYGDALEIADKTVLLKSLVKEVARKHGLYATFMAKPWTDESGNGFHIHQSLWDLELNENVFQKDEAIAKQYLAGLVNTASEFMAFTSPSINSYKRFSKNSFAPINVSWGNDNRTAAVRALLGQGKGSRFEHRTGSADTNPYLAIAASIAGGLHGIENKLDLYTSVSENAYLSEEKLLPSNLEKALDELEKSKIASKYFTENFINFYISAGRHEVSVYEKTVTEWEFNRYFEYS